MVFGIVIGMFITNVTWPDMRTAEPDASMTIIETPPPFTPEIQERLDQRSGFDVFVSYTENGFQPARISLESGQTLRVTNNSGAALSIVEAAGSAYGGGTCDIDMLSSCAPIGLQHFWEFTFEKKGQWTVLNAGTSAHQLSVTVR